MHAAVDPEEGRTRERTLIASRRRAVATACAFLVAAVLLRRSGSVLTEDARWAVPVGLLVGVPAFGIVAYRAEQARRCLGAGCRRVVVVGWVRVPDGHNYAVFTSGQHGEAPEIVVRLPRHRRLRDGPAWVCGVDLDAVRGTASLFTEDGTLIGFGRVRSAGEAAKVWGRSGVRPPWWMPGQHQPPRLRRTSRSPEA